MRKLIVTCLITLTAGVSCYAQTLFTYGKQSVGKDEFLKIYEKNSIGKSPDYSEKALREYLDLYALFKMKVNEADLQQVDTMMSIEYELNNFRKQIAKNFMTDEGVEAKLVKEAYERLQEEIYVSHILILSSPMASVEDTAEAYRKVDSIYNAITKKKADFAKMAEKYSDDRQSKERGGDIGYITALQAVYPFENVAYSTPVGKVSKPFRTQFGYHILKVHDRRQSQGEVKVAQILIAAPKAKGEEGLKEAKEKLAKVQAELKKGVSFDELVEKYSDDKFSRDNNGVLEKFGVGAMVPVFEKAAFGLKKPGDISDPVQTDYGFHIIKLIEKYPLESFDQMEGKLRKMVQKDSRSEIARDAFFEAVKVKNDFKEYPENLKPIIEKIKNLPDTGRSANTFVLDDFKGMDEPLFSLKGKNYMQSDFLAYAQQMTRGRLMGPREAVMKDLYTMYVKTVVNDVEEHNLIEENPAFKTQMEEYRAGVMLFELMDRNVWSKAAKDTAGLRAYYQQHKDKYVWDAGFRGAIYKFKDEAALKQGLKLINAKNVKPEDVVEKMNTKEKPDAVTVQKGYFEYAKMDEFNKDQLGSGQLSETKKNDDSTYSVAYISERFNGKATKTLEEARGYAIADYQDYLEKKWHKELKEKYPVKVNEKVFSSMVK